MKHLLTSSENNLKPQVTALKQACIAYRYMIQINLHMIRSFKDKKLKRFYDRGDASKLPPDMVPRIEEIMTLLDIAHDIQDMDVPYFKLHPLTGNRKGEWAVTVRANWRIVFKFDDEPYDVELIDYH